MKRLALTVIVALALALAAVQLSEIQISRAAPGRDGGNPAGCTDPVATVLTVDQRGKKRPADGNGDGIARCDIGAFEAQNELFLPVLRR